MALRSLLAPFTLLAVLPGCEDAPRTPTVADASATAKPLAPPPPLGDGCARAGTFESLETDPACVVPRANEDTTRAALKQLTITLEAEPPEVVAGSTSLLVLTVKNTSSSEATLFLEARSRNAGPRTDWSRVVGIPEPHPTASEVPRLLFPATTTDAQGHDVDSLPTVATNVAPPVPTLLAVRLRPGAKLVRNASWWALRIPAPPPVVKDDAGHRFYPKTTALPLTSGEYGITLEMPFAGLGREERKISTRVKVIPAPLMDGGVRRF